MPELNNEEIDFIQNALSEYTSLINDEIDEKSFPTGPWLLRQRAKIRFGREIMDKLSEMRSP